jgi:hypothetical protein
LLDADATIERCLYEINDRRNRPTPESTIEAIMCAMRERGVGALEEPKIVNWLSECDAAAKAEIDRRIAAKDTAR